MPSALQRFTTGKPDSIPAYAKCRKVSLTDPQIGPLNRSALKTERRPLKKVTSAQQYDSTDDHTVCQKRRLDVSYSNVVSYLKNSLGGAAIGGLAVASAIAGGFALGADMQALSAVLSDYNLVSIGGSFGQSVSLNNLLALGIGAGAGIGVAKRAIQDQMATWVERGIEAAKSAAERSKGPQLLSELSPEQDMQAARIVHHVERRKDISVEKNGMELLETTPEI